MRVWVTENFPLLKGTLFSFPGPLKRVQQPTVTLMAKPYDWATLIMANSWRNVSKVTDWLSGLSGIARRFGQRGLGRYLAGLWEKDLVNLLSRESAGQEKTEESAYCPCEGVLSPSWSWISVTSTCTQYERYPFWAVDYDVDVLDARRKVPGPNPFRPIKRGSLTLNVYIKTATEMRVGKRYRVQQTFELN